MNIKVQRSQLRQGDQESLQGMPSFWPMQRNFFINGKGSMKLQ